MSRQSPLLPGDFFGGDSGAGGGGEGFERVERNATGVAGGMGDGGGVSAEAGGCDGGGIFCRACGGVRGDGRGADRSAIAFASRPSARRLDRLARPVIVRHLFLEQPPHTLCALRRPERQRHLRGTINPIGV